MSGKNTMAVAKEYTFAWKIENYYLHYLTGKDIKSPVFTPKHFGGSKWYLMLKSRRNCNEFFIFLCRSNDDLCDDVISVSFRIYVRSVDGNTVMSRGNRFMSCDFKRGGCCNCGVYPAVETIRETNVNWDREIIIVNCQIFLMDGTMPRCEVVTEVGINTFSFKWKIKMSKDVQSRTFSVSKTAQYEMSVSLPHTNVLVKIKKIKGNSALPIALCGKISLLNKEEDVDISLKTGFSFCSTTDELWRFPCFITKEDLENEENRYLDNGSFSLFCEFSEPNGNNHSNISKNNSHISTKLNNIIALHSDFDELLKLTDEKHSDIKLQTEDAILFAHKSVLIARSPVFRVMFDHDMAEEQSGVIEIVDVDTVTMKIFLKFLYSGNVDIADSESAMKLLMVANKYQVPTLLKTASNFLLSVLTSKIACKVLYLADMIDLDDLKKVALNYVSKHVEEISKSSDWTEYIEKNARLLAEVSAKLLAKIEIEKKRKWLKKKNRSKKKEGKHPRK